VPERGVVKWFSNTKGYGFIKMADGQDAFAHYSDIAGTAGDYKTLEEGMTVEFDLLSTERGPKAVNIVKVDEVLSPGEEQDQPPAEEQGQPPGEGQDRPTY